MQPKKQRILATLLSTVLGIALFLGIVWFFQIRVTLVKPQSFESSGMRIELTNQFSEITIPNMTVGFSSPRVLVQAGHAFDSAETLDAYTQRLYSHLAALDAVTVSEAPQATSRGTYFAYTAIEADGSRNRYDTYSYHTANGIWTVQFVCVESDYGKLQPSIQKWEQTVQFSQ